MDLNTKALCKACSMELVDKRPINQKNLSCVKTGIENGFMFSSEEPNIVYSYCHPCYEEKIIEYTTKQIEEKAKTMKKPLQEEETADLHNKITSHNLELPKMDDQIKQLEKEKDHYSKQVETKINELKLEKLRIQREMLSYEYDLNFDNVPTNFYDVILDITSLKSLKKGWKIICTDQGEKKFEIKNKDLHTCVVGVVGNFNKGKSFILGQLSNHQIPHGHSIQTKGISVKYPNNIKHSVTLLDSAGFETPIKVNWDEEKKNEETIEIEEIARDRQLTEFFLQSFIIENSDVLLMVVGILTFSDQKLLNKLKKLCRNRKLFVIHNLSNFVQRSQVERYLEFTLMKTFHLKKNNFIVFESSNDHIETKQNDCYFVEVSKEYEIIHLILANDDSSAGKFYNPSTFEFLKNQMQCCNHLKPFNVIEAVQIHLFNMSKQLFEEEIKDFSEIISEERTIKLSNQKEILLKQCLIDELGYSSFRNSCFKPKYQLHLDKKNEKLVLVLEIPDLEECGIQTDVNNEYRLFCVEGEKSMKSQEKIRNGDVDWLDKGNVESGNFNFQLQVPLKSAEISNTDPIDCYENGVLTIIYDLEKKKEKKRKVLVLK